MSEYFLLRGFSRKFNIPVQSIPIILVGSGKSISYGHCWGACGAQWRGGFYKTEYFILFIVFIFLLLIVPCASSPVTERATRVSSNSYQLASIRTFWPWPKSKRFYWVFKWIKFEFPNYSTFQERKQFRSHQNNPQDGISLSSSLFWNLFRFSGEKKDSMRKILPS